MFCWVVPVTRPLVHRRRGLPCSRIAADERISLHSGVGSNVASSAANSSVFTEYTVTANGSFRKTKTTNGVTETTVFVEKKPVMLC